jgi:ribosomal protein S18 acetylase RimI-like enzyme
MIYHPARTPSDIVTRYPAHLHLKLLPRQQRRGVGVKLLERWLQAVRRHDAPALHVGVNRANTGAIAFWRKCRFELLSFDGREEGRTLWMGRPGC